MARRRAVVLARTMIALGLVLLVATAQGILATASPEQPRPRALSIAFGLSQAPVLRLGSWRLIACAPGYPGSTAQAQAAMDDLARMLESAASLEAGLVSAEYYENEATGIERLAAPGSAMALVPFPFFLKYADELGLEPLLQVTHANGATAEKWNLVTPRDRIQAPADLASWEITGISGYAPSFVKGPVLADWGRLPADVQITFTSQVLSSLRRAARGETTAVLLDATQAEALEQLPFANALETVVRSRPLAIGILAKVGSRLDDSTVAKLTSVLPRIHREQRWIETLSALRLDRFVPVDFAALDWARAAYASVLP